MRKRRGEQNVKTLLEYLPDGFDSQQAFFEDLGGSGRDPTTPPPCGGGYHRPRQGGGKGQKDFW